MKALEIVADWRERLFDLGWFMKCLNEYLARRANEEDCCKGWFWESRYKCQALLDEQALLSCMAYVDLNPVRVGMATTPESADYTSLQQRSEEMVAGCKASQKPRLLSFVEAGNVESGDAASLCRFRFMDYLQLVDMTGRIVWGDKRGAISGHAADVLDRLGIDQQA